jgi:hypothetical protein
VGAVGSPGHQGSRFPTATPYFATALDGDLCGKIKAFATKEGPSMSIAEIPRTMTAEEFLALPDDGVERWLIRGELRENRKSDRIAEIRTIAER